MSNLILADSIEMATSAGAPTAEFRAGGTDLNARRRLHVSHGDVVDVRRLPGLDQIEPQAEGQTHMGALVTLDTAAHNEHLITHYPAVAMSCGALATPQIRIMGTLGGVLLQRTRCWYFRHEAFDCYKKGGDECPAREGDHRFGVVFDQGPCVFPHPSTVGMVLMAYEAVVTVQGAEGKRQMRMADLYGDGRDGTRDHLLAPGELLTEIVLPPPLADERASYFRSISRARAEWALVEACVRLVVDEETNVITAVFVAVGGVAPVPLRLPQVEAALLGKAATPTTFASAAKLAADGASPLSQTKYKVPLLVGTVQETIQRAYDRVWGGEG
ncbi:MAG: FAD binding domain-containing protein [Anaerolineales bacterium]|nr:FAD binding domain-containing protein [Anaerolineales bacterium]